MNKVNRNLSEVKSMEYKNFVDLLVDIKDFDEEKVKILLDARYPRGVFYENNSSWREYHPLKIDTIKSDIYPYVKKYIGVIKDYLHISTVAATTVDLINIFAPFEERAKYTNDIMGDSCRCNWLISVLLLSRTVINDNSESEAYSILRNKFSKEEIVNAIKQYPFNLSSVNEFHFIINAIKDLGLFKSEVLSHNSGENFVKTLNHIMIMSDRWDLYYFFSKVELDHRFAPGRILSTSLLNLVWEKWATCNPRDEENIEILCLEFSKLTIWESPDEAIRYAYAHNGLPN